MTKEDKKRFAFDILLETVSCGCCDIEDVINVLSHTYTEFYFCKNELDDVEKMYITANRDTLGSLINVAIRRLMDIHDDFEKQIKRSSDPETNESAN